MNFTYISTDNTKINMAFHIALSDLYGNIKPFKDGLLKEEKPIIIAGMGYCEPWTRDAAINTYNAGGLLFPDIAKDTLISVLKNANGQIMIGGEYWDSIIWVWAAWSEYILTGDRDFLKKAYEAAVNTLKYFEKTEFDDELNLFRGPACYGDGVSAYPDIYASPGESGIMAFAEERKDLIADKGIGIPMYVLSTNCLYYNAYKTADLMAIELGLKVKFEKQTENMKNAINKHFWTGSKYRYIVDKFGGCDYDEGMGNAFVIMFGIADDDRAAKILQNQHITAYGIPCVYPSFPRYKGGYGRHSGTVWPHIQSFWANAAVKYGRYDLFDKEFNMLTDCSVRDGYFAEIYHPDTGECYGGLQEFEKNGIIEWRSEKKQTWSATGYLHMMFANIVGMQFKVNGIEFKPYIPGNITELRLRNLFVRGNIFNITIRGNGSKIQKFTVNNEVSNCFVPYNGNKDIEILMS